MKICFITSNIAQAGGVQRVLSVVANGLAENNAVSILMLSGKELAERHYYPLSEKVEVLHCEKLVDSNRKYLVKKAFRYLNRKGKGYRNANFMQKIYFPAREMAQYEAFFREHSFDVIIGVQLRAAGVVAQLSCKAMKIGWMHNTYEAYFGSKDRYQWHQERMFQKLLPGLDRLIVLTDHDKKEYAEHIPMGEKIVRIYNPLSFESALTSTVHNRRMLFLGRFQYEQKGLGLLVKALEKLKNDGYPFAIDIVGDGPDRNRFLQEAADAGVLSRMNLVGQIQCVTDYYLSSDMLLLPSKYEGFGLVVTEAMECGVPVISFETEGPSEIITDGVNGYLVEKFDTDQFADRIRQLSEDVELRIRMGEAAKKRAGDFAVSKITREWNALWSTEV